MESNDSSTTVGHWVSGFLPTLTAIFTWMVGSYVLVHLIGFVVAVTMLRHHVWMPFISLPFIVMAVLGPTTLGALTSASIALTFSMADKSISMYHCAIIGCGQTIMIVVTSFLRLLATL